MVLRMGQPRKMAAPRKWLALEVPQKRPRLACQATGTATHHEDGQARQTGPSPATLDTWWPELAGEHLVEPDLKRQMPAQER